MKKPGLVNATTWQELGIDVSNGNKKLLTYQGKAKKVLYGLKPNIIDSINKYEKFMDSIGIKSRMETEHPRPMASASRKKEAEYAELKEHHSKLPATVVTKLEPSSRPSGPLRASLGILEALGRFEHWRNSSMELC